MSQSFINKLIDKKVTKLELAFVLHVSEVQDKAAPANELQYVEICRDMGISIQKYYDILNSLTGKQIITCAYGERGGYVVRLLGNAVRCGGDCAICINDLHFDSLCVGTQLLMLYLCSHTSHGETDGLRCCNEFRKRYGVSERTLRMYVMELRTLNNSSVARRPKFA